MQYHGRYCSHLWNLVLPPDICWPPAGSLVPAGMRGHLTEPEWSLCSASWDWLSSSRPILNESPLTYMFISPPRNNGHPLTGCLELEITWRSRWQLLCKLRLCNWWLFVNHTLQYIRLGCKLYINRRFDTDLRITFQVQWHIMITIAMMVLLKTMKMSMLIMAMENLL